MVLPSKPHFIEHQVGFFGSSTPHRRRLTKRNFENAFRIGLISIQIRFINKMFKINGLQVNGFIKKDIIRPLGIIGSSPGLFHAVKGKFYWNSNFLDWFQPYLKFPAKRDTQFSQKLIFELVKFGWKRRYANLKLSKIHNVRIGILWNVPFSSKRAYNFRRENSNMVKIINWELDFLPKLTFKLVKFGCNWSFVS